MRLALTLTLTLALAAPAQAAPCGGDWQSFLDATAADARAAGLPETAITGFLAGATQDAKVLKSDRAQGVFRKTFLEFSKSLISSARLQTGLSKAKTHADILARAEKTYGVPPGILLAFWAFETDFGNFQGDFNTRNALLTLAHDCRRPEMFQPQVLAAMGLEGSGSFDPATTTGAWAGEIGMVQMLPKDILERGVDGDGDGHITLKTSVADALLSGAALLQSHGWRGAEPWLQEVSLPDTLDWAKSGLDTELSTADWAAMGVKPRTGTLANLPASLLLPQGRKGPAFLVYPNYKVLFEWNKSFIYVTTAAYFATRLSGAPALTPGTPDPALSADQMIALQTKLAALGHDVGKIDGIMGAATRTAIQSEQSRLGLPADAWPTLALLNAL